MTVLNKYKVYILVIWIGIITTIFLGAYYFLEREKAIKDYINTSERLIQLTSQHLKNGQMAWRFSLPMTENYKDQLYNMFTMAKSGFQVNEMMVMDTKGQIIFSSWLENMGEEIEEEQIQLLDPEKTIIYLPKIHLSSIWKDRSMPIEIETYSPLYEENQLKGYVRFKYYSTTKNTMLLVYDRLLIPSIGLLIIVLFIFLVLYLKRYNVVEEKTENNLHILTQLFDNASDGIVIIDQDKRIRTMNKEMEEILGKEMPEFSGPISCDQLLCCTAQQYSEKDCPLMQSTHKGNRIFEFDLLNHKGEKVNVSASVSTWKDETTNESQTIMLIRDETSKKREELQLEILEDFERLVNTTFNMTQMTTVIESKMKALTGCNRVYVFEGESYDRRNLLNIKEEANIELDVEVPFEENLLLQVYLTKKIQVMEDGKSYHHLQKKYHGESLVAIPLIVNEKIIGALLLVYKVRRYLEPNRKNILKRFSTHIAALLKVYKLIMETHQQKELNEQLYKLDLTLQTDKGKQEIPTTALTAINQIIESDFIAFRSIANSHNAWDSVYGNRYTNIYNGKEDLLDITIKWGRSLYIERYPESVPTDLGDVSLIEREELKTIMVLPLIYNNKILGAVIFGFRGITPLTEEKKKTIRNIVNMLSVQIENKNLQEQIENEATIIERQRISREIHDGLAQNIGFINIQMHRLKRMLEKEETTKAIQEIDVIKEAVESSYIDLRETIDQLRDLNSYKKTLGQWLKEYIQDFEQAHGIRVVVEMKQMNDFHINDNQKVQITRVIQEILNNIRKHAHATQVSISVVGGNQLSLIVRDNGVGFDKNTLEKRKYSGNGLMILKERVESIQGSIEIDSKLKEGTTIRIHIPKVS